MTYVDGYVLAVPRTKLNAYKKLAKLGAKLWMEHGALAYTESVSDDMNVHCGIPFPKMVKPRKGEVIIFSWIVFKSKADRKKVNALVMKDPRLSGFDPKKMPFDVKRMSMGGFKVLVEV